MTGLLADFQQAFAEALRAEAGAVAPASQAQRFAAQPGFAVYRNTVTKGWVDALEANFPAVVAIVGEDWFRAAATVYVRQTPPSDPVLACYGDTFPLFLARFAPAAEMPYLEQVAALDRLWSEAAHAADAPPAGAAELAALDARSLAAASLRIHPAARFIWMATTAPSIWLDARRIDPGADEIVFEECGEGILLARPGDAVTALRITIGGHCLLDRLAAGDPFGAAAEQALMTEPRLDFAALFATLLERGVFSGVEPAQEGNRS